MTAPDIRVAVLTSNDASTIVDCLDALAEVVGDRPDVEVVVVDLNSSDDSTDRAIRHPLVDGVLIAPDTRHEAVLDRAASGTRATRLASVSAALAPDAAWWAAVEETLRQVDFGVGPSGDPSALAIDLSACRNVGLFPATWQATGADLVERAVLAGRRAEVVPELEPPEIHIPVATPRSTLPAQRLTGTIESTDAGTVSISVAICTRDRSASLDRCLASLSEVVDDAAEVLVVDNGDRLTIDASKLPIDARVVHEPGRGLDRARNRALAEAVGDVVAFIDDDCEADPGWIRALRGAFADDRVAAATGRVRPARLSRPTQRWFELRYSFDRGREPTRFAAWDRRDWWPLWPGIVGTGCNTALRRDVADALGGFDEHLDRAPIFGGGDLDMYIRLIEAGQIIEYVPAALVWHHHRETEDALRRQFWAYGVGVGALLTKAVLERPGQGRAAARFYVHAFKNGLREIRAARRGTGQVPARLILVDLVGQLVGPAVYLRVRRADSRR